jgi:hypothetical protein
MSLSRVLLVAKNPIDGQPQDVLTDGTGKIQVAGASGGGGGDGAILDGVDPLIKATVTAAKALKVDGSAVTQPVSGTFWQATQPISAVSLPLPTGAAAEHTGAASYHSVRLTDGTTFYDGRSVTVQNASLAITAASLPLPTGAATDASLTNGNQRGSMKLLDSAGTNVATISAAGALRVDGSAVTQPVSGTFWQATQPVSIAATVTVDTELPAAAALADATANPTVPLLGAAQLVFNGTTWDRQRGDTTSGAWVQIKAAIPAGTNLIGRMNLEPQTANGLLVGRVISAATTNATSVKGSAGQVYGWYLYNANAAVRYLKIYNKASAPTVGTDTPIMTIPIPPGSAANVEYTNGVAFGTGIAIAITTGVADSDTGAVAANEIIVNLLYK